MHRLATIHNVTDDDDDDDGRNTVRSAKNSGWQMDYTYIHQYCLSFQPIWMIQLFYKAHSQWGNRILYPYSIDGASGFDYQGPAPAS